MVDGVHSVRNVMEVKSANTIDSVLNVNCVKVDLFANTIKFVPCANSVMEAKSVNTINDVHDVICVIHRGI
jgi:hypothetical protein